MIINSADHHLNIELPKSYYWGPWREDMIMLKTRCPQLWPFWNNIISLIANILQSPCPSGPEFLLLLIGIDTIPSPPRKLICNILHAAQLVIARKRKSLEIPSMVEINDVVSTIYIYEGTLAWYRGTVQTFMRDWWSWLRLFLNLNWQMYSSTGKSTGSTWTCYVVLMLDASSFFLLMLFHL